MNSSLIGKIEKAKWYAQEKNRIQFEGFSVAFRGENDTHRVSFGDGRWHCNCNFFRTWQDCSHTMALRKVLDGMLPQAAYEQHTFPNVTAAAATD